MFKIILNDEKLIKKDLSKIPEKLRSHILDKIEELSELWLSKSNIKYLNHYDLCDYRLRVWNYRVLFDLDLDKNEIVIFRILHRNKLY